jgi:hypothetical protein
MRRIPLSRRSHVTGFQVLPGGIADHESALERDFVTLASFRDAAATVISQPVTIPFWEGANARRYTPDFLVHWSNGRFELIEVKYRTDLRSQWKLLRPAFVAARAWSREHKAGFRIATDRSIRCPLLQNAKRLLPLRAAQPDPALASEVVAAMRALAEPTFGQLIIAIAGNRAAVLGTLWRMIARGQLRADLGAPIGLNTQVALP